MITVGFSSISPAPLGHDSTVTILEDGIIKATISEERLSRVKHDGGFPAKSLQYCLDEIDVRISDIDKIAVGFGLLEQYIDSKNDSNSAFAKRDSRFFTTSLENKKPIFYNHQYIHARTGYALSGFNKAVIISLDGGGQDEGKTNSGGIFIADKGEIKVQNIFPISASLGFTYGLLTQACGFRMQDGEGKTMSLAAFGDKYPDTEKQNILKVVERIFPKFKNMEYIEGGVTDIITKFENNVQLIANSDNRINAIKNSFDEKLIAWAAQKNLEDIISELILNVVDNFGIKNVIVSGGVFMNMILNMKIRERLGTGINIFFNPICGDLGNSIGAAIENYFQETGKNISHSNLSLYQGSEYMDEEIIAAIKKLDLKYEKVNKVDTAIDLISKGNVIGWYQGRSELGARSLGNRSILSLATNTKFKDIVNDKVKKRESWRPFCPTIIDKEAQKHLENPTKAPYMILGFRMKTQSTMPAVCHIDGTCRPQILEKIDNKSFYDVVKGVGGIVLNTSFNLAGEPIVETPFSALAAYKNSAMDAVIINDFLIKKK
jgi:carbamoyltransferase